MLFKKSNRNRKRPDSHQPRRIMRHAMADEASETDTVSLPKEPVYEKASCKRAFNGVPTWTIT